MVERLIFVARNNGFKRNEYVMGSSPLDFELACLLKVWATKFGDHEHLPESVFEMLFPEDCWLNPGEGSIMIAVQVNTTHTVLGLWDEGIVIDPEQKGD